MYVIITIVGSRSRRMEQSKDGIFYISMDVLDLMKRIKFLFLTQHTEEGVPTFVLYLKSYSYLCHESSLLTG